MCMSTPSQQAPAPPPPPPPAPTLASGAAGQQAQARARQARGPLQTIMTSPQGLTAPASTDAKTLLSGAT